MRYRLYRLLGSFGLGVGAAMVAMALFPVLQRKLGPIAKSAFKEGMGWQPLLKSAIKGGLSLKEQMMRVCAESKEKFEDLVAEVKEEMGKKE